MLVHRSLFVAALVIVIALSVACDRFLVIRGRLVHPEINRPVSPCQVVLRSTKGGDVLSSRQARDEFELVTTVTSVLMYMTITCDDREVFRSGTFSYRELPSPQAATTVLDLGTFAVLGDSADRTEISEP